MADWRLEYGTPLAEEYFEKGLLVGTLEDENVIKLELDGCSMQAFMTDYILITLGDGERYIINGYIGTDIAFA